MRNTFQVNSAHRKNRERGTTHYRMLIHPQTFFINVSNRSPAGKSRKTGRSILFESPRPLRTIAEENLNKTFNKHVRDSMGEQFQRHLVLKKPMRIELPLYFNTPQRAGFSMPEYFPRRRSLLPVDISVDIEERLRIRKRLKDYQLLGQACKRGKKTRDEGRAYYSIGVLLDNIGALAKAIRYYERFLEICKSMSDKHGEALAYNCLGVNYQLLAPTNKSYYEKATKYHIMHEGTSDLHGKFIANINLGLLHADLSIVFW